MQVRQRIRSRLLALAVVVRQKAVHLHRRIRSIGGRFGGRQLCTGLIAPEQRDLDQERFALRAAFLAGTKGTIWSG